MIAAAHLSRTRSKSSAWQARFLSMLPAIVAHARLSFRNLPSEAREEAIHAAVCNACAATARLAELGKLDLAYPTVLARFGAAQVKEGRMTGGRLNCRDVMSPYCRRRKDIVVERLDKFDDEENRWQEAVVIDTRTAPVPDTVAFRVDFRDWLKSLPRRDRRVAQTLAIGNRTGEVAARFSLSEGRVSQLRKELAVSWREFVDAAKNHSRRTAPG